MYDVLMFCWICLYSSNEHSKNDWKWSVESHLIYVFIPWKLITVVSLLLSIYKHLLFTDEHVSLQTEALIDNLNDINILFRDFGNTLSHCYFLFLRIFLWSNWLQSKKKIKKYNNQIMLVLWGSHFSSGWKQLGMKIGMLGK